MPTKAKLSMLLLDLKLILDLKPELVLQLGPSRCGGSQVQSQPGLDAGPAHAGLVSGSGAPLRLEGAV
ncbi:unnamed protein product [Protopolystoma xenopodis]|uniref:Uncharacterized protein n=1 Tax=Protopolystoma xenopodis TaxID=117903 RepID=A0A3S5B868_9PLAT|nr:unnamed protein product [Protopolystoma xenopodis]